MKITYGEATPIYNAYLSLGESEISGWSKVIKNIMAIRAADKEADERKRRIVEKFADKDDDGNYILKETNGKVNNTFSEKNMVEASESMKELMSDKVNVNIIILTEEDLLDNNKKQVALKANEIMPLYEKKLIK